MRMEREYCEMFPTLDSNGACVARATGPIESSPLKTTLSTSEKEVDVLHKKKIILKNQSYLSKFCKISWSLQLINQLYD